ncbi:MAG: chemotaxis protein CheR [Clostridia bacterium]|nr:chemotaxis protein CheR [Clostridia bacterium]
MKLTDEEYKHLADYMYKKFGINLKGKKTLIEARLASIIRDRQFQSFSQYIETLTRDISGVEDSIIVSKLTTNYTYFMREQGHYNFSKRKALPELCPRIKDKDLRVWSSACSSGEEPYSIAMMLDEYFNNNHSDEKWDKVVLASDISDNVLRTATQGVYSKGSMTALSNGEVSKYFTPAGTDTFKVTPYLRSQVAFKKINLMDPFSFKKPFHIIFCRNVMIYFDNQTKEKLINKFYDVLVPGGYLYIGLSESIINLKTKFTYVEPAIYKKEK